MGLDVKKEFESHLSCQHDDKLDMVGAVLTQQQDRVEEHLKAVDTEIMLMKTAFLSVPSRSAIRTPPGYAHLNLKGAYWCARNNYITGLIVMGINEVIISDPEIVTLPD